MKKSELQEIGKEILKKKSELLDKNRFEWESGKYTSNKAWEDAVKEVCLLL